MQKIRVLCVAALVGFGTVGAVLQGCTGDDDIAEPKKDAGSDSTLQPDVPVTPQPDSGGNDASDAGPVTSFTVPAGGGSVSVSGGSQQITFTFPASAAGTNVTFNVSSATAIGWGAGQFSDVIVLGPNGTRFADPVTVKPQNKGSLALVFRDGTTKSPADPLEFDQATGSFKLRHFSTLALVPPGKYCDSEAWNDMAQPCGDGGHYRSFGCKGWNFCTLISAGCCAYDDGGTCNSGSELFSVRYTPTEDTNGGQYPYCAIDVGDWDGGDAGCGSNILFYSFLPDGGCAVNRDCAQSGANYRMDCSGTTCTCVNQLGDGGGTTFQRQANTCDTATTMKTAFVQSCNFPPR
jgi:hypothetical protein